MIKRRLLFLICVLGFFAFISGCEADSYCKDCYIITYDPDGNIINETYNGFLCGEKLDEVDGTETTDPQGNRAVYECD